MPLKSIAVRSVRFFQSLHSYIIPFLLMFLSIIGIFSYFAVNEYKVNYNLLNDKLSAETERVERAFIDIIQHTEFVMKVIIMQIKHSPGDLDHIYSIISKYSVNPRLNNVLSWTPFSWLDNANIKRLDSIKGPVSKLYDYSGRKYIKELRKEPGRIHLGTAAFGTSSQRYVIPAAIGAVEEGEYIGALDVGFDLVNLSISLSGMLKDPDVYFALLDQNLDIILQSPNNLISKTKPINSKDLKAFINQHNLVFQNITNISNINILSDNTSYYLHKIKNYPFVIYLHYDNKSYIESFWKNIIFRIIEICFIAAVALVIIIVIYNREKVLRYKAEQAKQVAIDAAKTKTDFLAYTAHELRSPLGFIISGSEAMISEVFGPIGFKYREYIKSIYQSGKELLEFIDDLLDNMKIEQGSFRIEEAIVDVKKVILRSVKINNINYNHKIHIETNFADNLPFLISDHKRLLQVFNNIISNAIKYSSENTILNIDVSIYKGQMVINFQDHGYGMNEAELENSMNKYGVNYKDSNVKSVGLGLPLVKNLLDLMGARFLINSKIGEGTRVVIIFAKEKVKWNINVNNQDGSK